MLMRIFLDTRWAFSILVFLSVGSSVYAQALYGGGNASQNLGAIPPYPAITPW